MPKKIVTIGFELADENIEQIKFSSKSSLMDWDIVLFKPNISDYIHNGYGGDNYQGKPCLGDDLSFRLKESCEHWRREIKEAVESGKTIFVFLNKLESVYVATGEMRTSGTGRNQKETRIVTEYSNYSSLPLPAKYVVSEGRKMNLNHIYKDILHDYWEVFEEKSFYNVYFPENLSGASIITKTGNKAVSLVLRGENSNGALMLLPDIEFEDNSFFESNESEEIFFSKEGQNFSSSLISAIVDIDKKLRSAGELTEMPDWAKADEFILEKERKLQHKLLVVETSVEKAQKEKEKVINELSESRKLRALLYETGKPLEAAVLLALETLGFSVKQVHNNNSEFDVVVESNEGRLIGEVEGKDNKAINITKLRQLSLNIHEDLDQEDVKSPAKGILFGNGYRLKKLEDRKELFTKKCITSAETTSIGLLATSDLYVMAKHFVDYPDNKFAKECRELLINKVGIIIPPILPPQDIMVKTEDKSDEK